MAQEDKVLMQLVDFAGWFIPNNVAGCSAENSDLYISIKRDYLELLREVGLSEVADKIKRMENMNTDEIAYSQQKNREHIWRQVKEEINATLRKEGGINWTQYEHDVFEARYEFLCKQANITPW